MNKLGGQLSFRRGGFPNAFAHDTVLKPEQCGGPVVDLNGRAVGINIAREGRTESHAIPAQVIVGLITDLKSGRQFAAPANRLGPVDPPAVPLAN
jgi:serine protease Do